MIVDVRQSKVYLEPEEEGHPYRLMDMIVATKIGDAIEYFPADSIRYEPWSEELCQDAMRNDE